MAMLAARDCANIGGVVVWGGVSDLLLTYEERIDLRRMLKRVVGHPVKQREAYLERSPIHWIDQVNVPVLIMHSNQDENVSLRHATELARKMEDKGMEHELIIYDGQPHRFSPQMLEKAWEDLISWSQRIKT